MKKIIVFLLLSIAISSCEPTPKTQISGDVSINAININGKILNIYIIDGCEYIGDGQNHPYYFLTHKGNCKFCAERNKRN